MLGRASKNSIKVLGRPELSAPDPQEQEVSSGFGRMFQSLQNRDFLLLWLGMLGSFSAMSMQQVARGYLAYDLAGSATALGMVTVAWGIPQLFLSPFGGVIADRVSRRNLLIATQSFMATTTLINAILISTGHIQIWHLVILGLFQGGTFAFNMPARQALIPSIVGRDHLANAIAINNSGVNLTRIAGPALAGVMIGIPSIGIAGTFYVMAACYLITVFMLFQLPARQGSESNIGHGSMLQEMVDGAHYVRSNTSLLLLLASAFAVVLLGMPYQTLLPIFALKVHGVGPQGLGLLTGAAGVGALIGSLGIAYFSASPRKVAIQIAAGICFGIALIMFAGAPTYILAVAMMFLVGGASNMYMALNNTLIMMNTKPAMFGRVMSVYMMTFSIMPLAAYPMGILSDVIGVQWVVGGAGGLAALSVVGLSIFARVKSLRQDMKVI